jgi:hypothetical protein
METIPDKDALALIPVGRPSNDLEPVIETIASWSDPFSQRALLIGVSGCHATLFFGSDSERMSSRIGSLGTDEILKCPCGYRSDPRRACSCTPPQVEKYLSRISGPLLDRIDLHVEVPSVPFTQLAEMPPGPTSADLRAQVLQARARQSQRFGARGPQVNGRMTPRQVRKFCTLKPESMALLKAAMEDLDPSARAHDKVLRVARTIADLEGHDEIKPQYIAEAVGYRSLDRSVWA